MTVNNTNTTKGKDMATTRTANDIYREHGIELYTVTRLFTGGTLEGLTHIEVTPARFELGKEYTGVGSPFKIIDIAPAD